MLFGLGHAAYFVLGAIYVVVAIVLLIVALCFSDRLFKTPEIEANSKAINCQKAV